MSGIKNTGRNGHNSVSKLDLMLLGAMVFAAIVLTAVQWRIGP